MQTLVSLDLETTGLDPDRDAIIEIGAVRFRGARVEDEWTSLINPGRPVPPFVQQLTGIDDAMLAEAPRLSQVLGEVADFVGQGPILGHSVQFDLFFLQRKGILTLNQVVDTLDLASVLLPGSSRYNLRWLVDTLKVPVRADELHRALPDAHATRMVFLRLCELAQELPPPLLQEIVRLGSEIEWGAGWIFEQALLEAQKGEEAESQPVLRWTPRFPKAQDVHAPLAAAGEQHALDVEEVAATVEPGGSLAHHFSGYEHRSQQVAMLRAVADAFCGSQHLLVEAGTGTGKSMAYLIPAFAWAYQNGQRVVVSTNTINLQDQLIHKDVPDISRALGIPYRAAVLKGRGNYLCPRRLETWRRLGPQSPDEMRLMAKVMVWLEQGGSGDRHEINLRGIGEASGWSRLSAEDPDCSMETCLRHTGGACPYFQARQAAESAHVVIVNHALLLADIVTGNRVIPDYKHLIVDEAHHLEAATTQGLSVRVTETEFTRLLRELQSGPGSLLARISKLAKAGAPAQVAKEIARRTSSIAEQAGDCRDMLSELFHGLGEFLAQRTEERQQGFYGQRERIVPATRQLPEWTAIEIGWENVRGPLKLLVVSTGDLGQGLVELAESGLEGAEDLAMAVQGISRSLETIHSNMEAIIFEPQAGAIYWMESVANQAYPSLHVAPLEVGPLVEKHLWHEKEAVIMTSATLTAGGEFSFIRGRLKADDASELALDSPFDFENSTLLYLVNDIPEPTMETPYQRALEQGLKALCRSTHGRALVLFTSHEHLRRTARAITGPLETHGIRVIEQVPGSPRHFLLEEFRTVDNAVLLGTRSFWEGVDVVGPALSVLAIVRLPFSVPTDPIVAARAETYEAPFQQYSLPEAVLLFRQGFGRLIRSRSDRGVAVVFDRRVLSKSYGQLFVQSLPGPTVRSGPLADLPQAAARWLGD